MQQPLKQRSALLGAYADVVEMARRMWPVLLVLGVVYLLAAMSWFIASAVVPTWIGRYVARMLMFVGLAWAAAPFYVALHRFVALGEIRWLPSLDVVNGEARVYAAYAGLSTALYFVPFIVREVLTALGFESLGWLAFVLLVPALLVVLVRTTTLLPMAALSPATASWSRALAHSRGRIWNFFVAGVTPALPAFVLLCLLGGAAAGRSIEPVPFFALAIATLLVLQLAPLAVATRLYQQHGSTAMDELRRSGRLPPALR